VDTIDLFQLHRIDPAYPLEDQVGELAALRDEGKIRHLGLSEVGVEELRAAQRVAPIVSVQNRFSLGTRNADDVLQHCEQKGIAFIPWRPLADHVEGDDTISAVAKAHDATPAQVAIAWLLRLSPVMLPIPGTSRLEHLEQNIAAAAIDLTDEEMAALGALAG
jgi:pyridoxine 4-dehydrogenase